MEPMSKEASMLQIGGDSGEVAPTGTQDTEVAVELEEADSLSHRMVPLIICQVQEEEAEEEGVHSMAIIDTTSKGRHTEEAGNTLKVKVNTSSSKGAADHSSAGTTMHLLLPEATTIILAIRGAHQEDPVEAVGGEVVEDSAEGGVKVGTMAPILRVMLAMRH